MGKRIETKVSNKIIDDDQAAAAPRRAPERRAGFQLDYFQTVGLNFFVLFFSFLAWFLSYQFGLRDEHWRTIICIFAAVIAMDLALKKIGRK